MDKILCKLCDRPLTNELSRKLRCGPRCLKILNQARKIYQAENKKNKKAEIIKNQISMDQYFEEVDKIE